MNNKVEKVLAYFNAEHDEDETAFWVKDGYMCCNETGMDESRVQMIAVDSDDNKIRFMTDEGDWSYPYDKGLAFIEECSVYKIEKVI